MDSALLHNSIKTVADAGVVLVATAGNEGTGAKVYPAAYPEVIAVSASDMLDERWTLPSAGLASNYGPWVDIAAPGSYILSTVPGDAYDAGEYGSGTSMAAPHVSGVAGLLFSLGLSSCEIEGTILDPANVDPINWDGGVGRLNAAKAVQGPFPSDTDCDGYSNSDENLIGTSPFDACADTSTPDDEADDKWPPDFNDDQLVSGTDVLRMGPVFGTMEPGPPFERRYDLRPDGVITGSDMLQLGVYFGTSC